MMNGALRSIRDVRSLLALATTAFAIASAALLAPSTSAQDAPPAGELIDGMRITELSLCVVIEEGNCVSPTNQFRISDGRVQALIRVENTTGAETTLRVSFQRADAEVGPSTSGGLELNIPAQRRYRTQARTGTRRAGSYRVVVRTAEGNVLGQAEYTVSE